MFNNSLQGAGGVMQTMTWGKQRNPYKVAAGSAVATGMWGGLLIPEDKYAGLSQQEKTERLSLRAQGKEPENGFNTKFTDNPVAWIQEKPLRLSGIGPIIGNFLTAASALFHDRHTVNEHFGFDSHKFELNPANLWRDARRGTDDLLRAAGVSREALESDKRKKDWQRQYTDLEKAVNTQIGWKFTMMTPVFNIAANVLYGMSSKEERSVNLDKEGYLDEVITMAANIYSHVPQDQRVAKLQRFAGFLKSQPDININEQVIKERIEEKIVALEQTTWANRRENSKPETAISANERPELQGTMRPVEKELAPIAGI